MKNDQRMWGVLIHLGMNQWHDHYMSRIQRKGVWAGIPDDEYLEHIRQQYQMADHVRFDEQVWREVSESYAKNGVNTIVLDLGEAVAYPSHPELWVKNSWSIPKLQAELQRLRGMGFEVLPKLNFSASHCAWLGDYARMLSTKDYYRVCADVIRDVCEAFGHPRLFHLGLDEERITHHKCCSYACARQGDLWWHDLAFLQREVERNGSRAWMWIDHIAERAAENRAYERLPKGVVMSPWYYGGEYDAAKHWEVKVMDDLNAHGYDMIPCGSICFFTNDSSERLARYGNTKFNPRQVLGYLQAPWLEMNAYFKDRLILAGESIGRARKLASSGDRGLGHYDVVVCGGGPSGCAAALAARRSGMRVLLVEAQSRLGGTATSGGVSHWLGGRNDAGEWVVGGIFRELSERAVREGAALLPKMPKGRTYQPYAWLPWFVHGVVIDPERVALMLDEVMAEAGVEVLFETSVLEVERSGTRIDALRLFHKEGPMRVTCSSVIDSTGDADVAALASVPLLVGREGDHLTTPASLTFHLSHVDSAALWAEIERTREPKFRPLIADLRKRGEWPFPYDIFITVQGLAEDELMVNTMRLVEVDGTDPRSRSRAYVNGRREAFQLLEIFRRHFPGFQKAQMKSIAPMLGVRESRRLDGEFKLTVEDLREGREFPDTIGFSMYGWDLPDPKRPSVQPLVDETGGKFVSKAKKQLVTPIPFSTMVPKGVDNLLVTGRAISVERDVLGPLRVMAPCMAMGEAAGVAVGMADRSPTALRDELRRRGAIVDVAALPVVRERRDP